MIAASDGPGVLGTARVALVCRESSGDENLGVRYLAGALEQAGIPVAVLPLNGLADIGPVADRILRLGVPLVGISLSDNYVALDLLSLVEWLRRRGYAGHVVAGGALATVQRHDLLARHSSLDSIVRLEGERTLLALAERILSGEPWEPLPGLTTRTGDGPPLVHHRAEFPWRPLRTERLPTVLGVPSARVAASRGCPGQCAYCGSAAMRRTATEEARRAGWSPLRIVESGIAGRRVRPIPDFTDEVAELYHERGVRCFHLSDDSVLGSGETSALEWLDVVEYELVRRRVGRVAWSLMMEPSAVTERVADRLVPFGLIRTLIGVESLTPEGLDALGRTHDERASALAVERLHRRGVAVFFNSILLHPESNGESLARELSRLPLIADVPFDALPLLVYPGTELYQQLQRNGLLLGGQLGADYRLLDKTASRFRGLLHQLWASLPDWVPLASDAHEIATLQSFARRLALPAYDQASVVKLARTTSKLNAFRVDALKRVLAIAELDLDAAQRQLALATLVRSLRPGVAGLRRSLSLLRGRLDQDEASHKQPRRGFVRTTYAASLLVLNAACGGIARGTHDDGRPADASSGAGGVSAGETHAGAAGASASGETGGGGLASAGAGGVREAA